MFPVKISKDEADDWKATDFIDGYNSFIWTERYDVDGEFQLNTHAIEETMDLIPEGSLISEASSTEVMQVENHKITRDDEGNYVLETTGRDFTTFLESRITRPPAGNTDKWKAQLSYTTPIAIALIVDNSLANSSTTDRISGAVNHEGGDRVPNIMATYTLSGDTNYATRARWFKPENAYDAALKFMQGDNIGLRALRPPSINSDQSESTTHIRFSAGGVEIETVIIATSYMRFDVYDGADRTVGNAFGRDPVIFDASIGDLNRASYLISSKEYRNIAWITSSMSAMQSTDVNQGLSSTGLDRRNVIIDGGDQASGQTVGEFTTELNRLGIAELRRRRPRFVIDTDVSSNSQNVYGRDYFLGDKVTLQADFGITRNVRVSEYIRTEGAEGERGYPTFDL